MSALAILLVNVAIGLLAVVSIFHDSYRQLRVAPDHDPRAARRRMLRSPVTWFCLVGMLVLLALMIVNMHTLVTTRAYWLDPGTSQWLISANLVLSAIFMKHRSSVVRDLAA